MTILQFHVYDGDPDVAVAIVMGFAAAMVIVPIALFVIRRLNERWFDREWRTGRDSPYHEIGCREGEDRMSSVVSEQQIINALHAVPLERWGEVLCFLDDLRRTRPPSVNPAIQTAEDLLKSGLAGIWADRTDLGNSADFARSLRENAERREGGAHAAGQ